jgi:hypothetical protein
MSRSIRWNSLIFTSPPGGMLRFCRLPAPAQG